MGIGCEVAPSPPEGAALLPLRRRNGDLADWAVVDAEDEGKLGTGWYKQTTTGYVVRNIPHPAGGVTKLGYPRRTVQSLQREVMGLKHGDPRRVDHVDRDPLNCRKSNLRIATASQNGQNRRGAARGSSSKYRGVSWSKVRRKWLAYGRLNGVDHRLGAFEDEEEAARVARDWRREHMPFSDN